MAFDGITISSIVNELNDTITAEDFTRYHSLKPMK